MTDTTPQDKADIPTPAAGTTDSMRNSGPKSRPLPQADALKERFKARSIPLEKDFADLIDLANMGRRAVGGAEDQTGPADGFSFSLEGRLELKPNEAKGISVDKNGVAVKIGNGIQIDTQGVSLKLAANSGLSADMTNGLKITPEQMFQKGMVMMFAGQEAEMPNGWALCNGENGTPDLRDRFVVGKGSKFTGKGEGTKLTDEVTVTGGVTVEETTLTLEQIPSHSHSYYYTDSINHGYYYGDSRSDMSDGSRSIATGYSGGGKGHKHTATLTTNPHKHSIDPIPPYYALAFIIKL